MLYDMDMKKTKIIAIASHKGGVGKTTTAATLGSLLSSSGRKTLLVDLDAQRNLTSTFIGSQVRPESSLYEAMCGFCDLPVLAVRENLGIVPASLDLGALDMMIAGKLQRESILRRLIDGVRDEYEWILLDCPSQMGLITVNAFTAANSLIVPLSCDAYAAEGLQQLLSMAKIVNSGLNPEMKLDGILITRFHTRRSLDRMVEADLRERFGDMVFDTRIRENATIVQAPVMSLDIISYDPRCNGAVDYKTLLMEVECRLDGSNSSIVQ